MATTRRQFTVVKLVQRKVFPNEKPEWLATFSGRLNITVPVYLSCDCSFKSGLQEGCNCSVWCPHDCRDYLTESCDLCDALRSTQKYLVRKLRNTCYPCVVCNEKPRWGTHKYCGITCAKTGPKKSATKMILAGSSRAS